MTSRWIVVPAVVLCLLTGTARLARAQFYSVTNNNSHIDISYVAVAGHDENGLIGWHVDNVSQLVQQWYWFRLAGVNNGNQSSLNDIWVMDASTPNPNQVYLRFSSEDPFEVHLLYTLTGGALGSDHSVITEQLTITNTGATALAPLTWFEYTDLDLSGPLSTFDDWASGGVTGITQQDNLRIATVTHSLTPDRYEITATNVYNWILFDKLDDSSTAYNLSNLGSPSNTGDVTFAFQWDLTIAAGESVTFTTTKEVNLIPEPGTLLLLGLGLVGLIAAHSRRQN